MRKGVIELENMEFYAFHGCFEAERMVGGEFRVDVRLEADIEKPAASDDIADAVDYVEVYGIVRDQMAVPSHLLEHVAARIADAVRERFPDLGAIAVKVSKKHPPIGGKLEKTSVEVYC